MDERCPLACPHGDQCTREAGHDGGCNHRECNCNEPNAPRDNSVRVKPQTGGPA